MARAGWSSGSNASKSMRPQVIWARLARLMRAPCLGLFVGEVGSGAAVGDGTPGTGWIDGAQGDVSLGTLFHIRLSVSLSTIKVANAMEDHERMAGSPPGATSALLDRSRRKARHGRPPQVTDVSTGHDSTRPAAVTPGRAPSSVPPNGRWRQRVRLGGCRGRVRRRPRRRPTVSGSPRAHATAAGDGHRPMAVSRGRRRGSGARGQALGRFIGAGHGADGHAGGGRSAGSSAPSAATTGRDGRSPTGSSTRGAAPPEPRRQAPTTATAPPPPSPTAGVGLARQCRGAAPPGRDGSRPA